MEIMTDIASQMTEMGRQARRASAVLARTSTDVKNRALTAMADALVRNGDLPDPGKRKGSRACARDRPLRGDDRPPDAYGDDHRGDRPRTRRGGRPARSRRQGHLHVAAAERPPRRPDAHPPRGDRHHLRIPPERHGGRGRPLPEVGQRRHPPRRLGGDPLQPRHRPDSPGCSPGPCAPGDGDPGRPHDRPGGGLRDAPVGGVHRRDHPARRGGADPRRRPGFEDPGDQTLQGGLPRLRRRRGGSRHGRPDLHECQDAAARGLQRDGDAPRP